MEYLVFYSKSLNRWLFIRTYATISGEPKAEDDALIFSGVSIDHAELLGGMLKTMEIEAVFIS